MKILFSTVLALFLSVIFCQAQKQFEVTIEGETYQMKEYYVVILKTGPNREKMDPKEADKLQPLHLAHLIGLYKAGKIVINGPFGGDGDWRGMSIYDVESLEEAKKLASDDPLVQAGWLAVEVHPWHGAIGSALK